MDSESMTEEIKRLKSVIADRDQKIRELKMELETKSCISEAFRDKVSFELSQNLTVSEIERYSRQIILPEINKNGQVALKNTSVLIVGAGGLGCPVGIYLSAAGIGKIGIVDHDVVDVNNLHRQIAHTERTVGTKKCESFMQSVKAINSSVVCEMYPLLLNHENIKAIIADYDIIVDASDNVPTRYLLNDAAVLNNKPLVSGAALKFEGQLTIYNYKGGPCYRCLFPEPPPIHAITNCSDGGVLGVVTGIIGCLQAFEVIKISVGLSPSYCTKMLIFDGLSGYFRIMNLRGKKVDCKLCGEQPVIKDLIDYEMFCNTTASDKDSDVTILGAESRITPLEYKQILDECVPHILVDVRPSNEVDICSLPGSLNIPLNLISDGGSIAVLQEQILKANCQNIYVVCRRGNDSQKAVIILQECFKNYIWKDIVGGLHKWHKEIDSTFPIY